MFSARIDDHLELRMLEPRHAGNLFELTERNRDHLRPWFPWADDAQTVADNEAYIRGCLQEYAKQSAFHMGIWHLGELVGNISLHGINPQTRRAEISYWLDNSLQGQGIVTRGCERTCTFAFEELGLNRVVIRCEPGSARSRAIPERLGFKQEGILRAEGTSGRGIVDLVVYGMLVDEWCQRRMQ